MTNERYLIASYFVGAALSVGLGTIVYLFLRRPFGGVADAASGKRLSSQEQISSVLLYVLVAAVFWDVIVLLILKYAQNGRKESQLPQVDD
jgi:hypothetical protein